MITREQALAITHDRDKDRIEKIAGLLDEVKQLRAELSRERELNQGLRQIVKDAYDYIPMETLRLKIRALLAAPVVTTGKENS
jgi:hypothetical protein